LRKRDESSAAAPRATALGHPSEKPDKKTKASALSERAKFVAAPFDQIVWYVIARIK
jgi:hypothetical protein